MSMSKSEGQGRTPVIRDEGFARRLETACEANPNCPTEQYRGKQKWVYDNLLEKFDIKVSPDTLKSGTPTGIILALEPGAGKTVSFRRIYNRAEHWDDRVRMMQWWADYLDKKAEQP